MVMSKSKLWNTRYTQKQYYADMKALFDPKKKSPLIQPSIDACIRFLENLPSEEQVEKGYEGISSDGADYASWGYALTGRFEEMDREGGIMFDWVNLYKLWFGVKENNLASHFSDLANAFANPGVMVEYLEDILD